MKAIISKKTEIAEVNNTKEKIVEYRLFGILLFRHEYNSKPNSLRKKRLIPY